MANSIATTFHSLTDWVANHLPPVPHMNGVLDIADLNRRAHQWDAATHHSDRWLADHGTCRDRLARETFSDVFKF